MSTKKPVLLSHLQNYPQMRLLRSFAPRNDNNKVVLSLRAGLSPLSFRAFASGFFAAASHGMHRNESVLFRGYPW